MEFFWKRSNCLGKEGELLHEEGEFTFNRTKKFALHSDEVSEVDKFFRKFVGGDCFYCSCQFSFSFSIKVYTTILSREEDLDVSCPIRNARETNLPEAAVKHYASCKSYFICRII